MGLKMINRDTLQVGDVVGVPYRVSIGWGNFRYDRIVPMTVTRITPKRTKFVLNNSLELTPRNSMVEYDEEAKKQTAIAECAKQLSDSVYRIDNLKREGKLFRLSDEKLVKIAALMKQIEEVVDETTVCE